MNTPMETLNNEEALSYILVAPSMSAAAAMKLAMQIYSLLDNAGAAMMVGGIAASITLPEGMSPAGRELFRAAGQFIADVACSAADATEALRQANRDGGCSECARHDMPYHAAMLELARKVSYHILTSGDYHHALRSKLVAMGRSPDAILKERYASAPERRARELFCATFRPILGSAI